MKLLHVFTGPVHSEKTTRALQVASRYQRLGMRVILLRSRATIRPRPHPEFPKEFPDTIDPTWDRPGTLVTKNGVEFPSTEFDSLGEVEELAEDYDVVWIDEIAVAAAIEPGKQKATFVALQRIRERAIIIISSLSATSEMEAFSDLMAWLLAVADEIVVSRADCDFCGRFESASRSVCLEEKDSQVLVGGEEVYKAACPECWDVSIHARLAPS